MGAAATAAGPMTAEEFFAWCERPENADGRYELTAGVPTPCPLGGYDAVRQSVATVLAQYVADRGAGVVAPRGDAVILNRDPDTVVTPDVAVFLAPPAAGAIPDLIVDILAPTMKLTPMVMRGERYLRKSTVPMAWFIDPAEQMVLVCRLKASIQMLHVGDTLTGNGVLPDFSCTVADFFTLPGGRPAAE